MTKISKIIDAGRSIEKNRTGFTVPELMSALNWPEDQKQYVQNTMFNLTRKGQAHKLNNTRPVLYTLKPHGAAIKKAQAPKSARTPQPAPRADEQPAPQTGPVPMKEPVVSLENLADMEIPLEMIGEGVFRRNRELERRIYELETDLLDMKRKLDDANKRISEKTRMIEKQNQIISGQNRDRRPTAKIKDVASITWKRRS